MIKLWQLLQNSGDYILFGVILIVVIILFIREFELTSPRAWMILIGLSTLGIVMIVRAYKKNKLLAELREREKALEEMEDRYRELKEERKISEERYQKAKEELDAAKKKAARDILEADETYKEELEEIDKRYNEMTTDELINESIRLLES
ncbi:MAG: hypothetical protein R3224_09500 [Balneolaceae bacterium]|nr:hypothetical protein [Balneolaceae bacterium]